MAKIFGKEYMLLKKIGKEYMLLKKIGKEYMFSYSLFSMKYNSHIYVHTLKYTHHKPYQFL